MCGVFGSVFFRTMTSDEKQRCIDSIYALQHRGPDFLGFKTFNSSIFMGHSRLSILDLESRSNQPFFDQSGRYVIVYNGEVYNYLEIKNELESRGYKFNTTSDTEVVLNAYIEWKEDCQYKFNGMWAFAIIDLYDQSLFLSRDRFGVKPLYIRTFKEGFQFASEIKAFLPWMGKEVLFNERYIQNTLLSSSLVDQQAETILEQVSRIMPGECLRMLDGNIQKKQWWCTAKHLPAIVGKEKDVIAEFQYLFRDACKIRLRSDVSFSTALSGGLDSSSIVSMILNIQAQEKVNSKFSAFIAHYPNSIQDEYEFAKVLTENKGIKRHLVTITHREYVDSIDRVIFATEDGYNLPTGPFLLYEKYKEKGVKISIDGHGADELLGGYIDYPQLIISRHLIKLSPLQSFQFLRILSGMGMGVGSVLKEYSQILRRKFFSRQSQNPSLFRSKTDLYLKPKLPEELSNATLLQKKLYSDFHYEKLPAILRRFDICSMAHGVEVRSPFLDWRLVSFGHALRDQFKLKKGFTKYILRTAMSGDLPQQIIRRRKKLGFTNPNRDWVTKQEFKEYVFDHIHSQSFLENRFFYGSIIRQKIQQCYKQNQFDQFEFLWPFVQTYRLMQLLKNHQTSSPPLLKTS